MKKRLIILLFFMMFSLPAFSIPAIEAPLSPEAAKILEGGVSFDWISKTQLQRDEKIGQIKEVLFKQNPTLKYPRKDFKKLYADYWKNKNYLQDYEDISNGKKEDAQKNYCGFYLGKILFAYGIQYKNNLKNIYYYDSMGSLRWVDVFSDSYPKFPYWSYQYYRNGEMVAAYYYVSEEDQYVFGPNKNFKGRWFRDKLFDRRAKVIMTRSNWGIK